MEHLKIIQILNMLELGIQKKNKLESKIQAEVITKMEQQGFFVVKLIKTNKNALTPPSLSSTLDVHGQGEGCADIGIETHQ